MQLKVSDRIVVTQTNNSAQVSIHVALEADQMRHRERLDLGLRSKAEVDEETLPAGVHLS